MPLKCAIVQQAASTSIADQSWTDSSAGFDNDVKAAVFFGSLATANHSNAGARITLGAMSTGPATYAISQHYSADGLTRNGRQESAYFYCASISAGGSSCEISPHATSPFLSNGVQGTYADAADEAHLISCLLLGGDIEANIVKVMLTAQSSVTGVAHGLSGTPELIIAMTTSDDSGITGGYNQNNYSVGFWDGTNYVCHVTILSSGNDAAGRITTLGLAARSNTAGNISTDGYLTLANVGSSTLDVVSNVTQTWGVSLLCLRGTSTPISAKCGTYTTPTGTGTAAMGLSLGAAPQVMIALQSRLTAIDTASTDDEIGLSGSIAACNNAGAGTQYGGTVLTINDSNVNYSQSTNSQVLRILAASDASADVEATVNAWQADDVQLNFSNAPASALKIPYLVFGMAGAGGAIPRILRSNSGMIDLSGNFRG